MNDLQQFLRAHESGLAQSFSDLEEFDAPRAHRKVVAKRRTRTILVTGAAALTLAGAAGLASLTLGSDVWQPGTDTTISDQSGLPSADPGLDSSTPSTPFTAAPRPEGMTDAEAIARANDPQTGEEWLAQPQAVQPPAGLATTDPCGSNSEWVQVGVRGDHRILFCDDGYIFESSPSGWLALIESPFPHLAIEPGAFELAGDAVTSSDIYYDSLAMPATYATELGMTVDLHGANPVTVLSSEWTVTNEAQFGSTALHAVVVSDYEFGSAELMSELSGAGGEAVGYAVSVPWGWYDAPLSQRPLSVTWSSKEQTAGGAFDPSFFENQCYGVLTLGAVVPLDLDHWSEAGSAQDGRSVFIPTALNPLLKPRYEQWLDHALSVGLIDSAATNGQELFRADPALAAVQLADGESALLLVNPDYSVRAWC